MKKKILKKIVVFSTSVLFITLLLMSIKIFTEGMYLLGIPRIEDVTQVSISYPDVNENVLVTSDAEDIELAVKLSGFLKYALFTKAASDQTPLITITYLTSDGTSVSVSANRDTVWYNGKTFALKEPDVFVNITGALFF